MDSQDDPTEVDVSVQMVFILSVYHGHVHCWVYSPDQSKDI